jgi:hypothetical protein
LREHDVTLSRRVGLAAPVTRRPVAVFHEMAGGALFARGSSPRAVAEGALEGLLARRAVVHIGVARAVLEATRLPPGARRAVLGNPGGQGLSGGCRDKASNAAISGHPHGRRGDTPVWRATVASHLGELEPFFMPYSSHGKQSA